MPPDSAMIFAAGFGTRMGELTKDKPKPMVPVAGRPLIDYALDIARDAAENIVVNLHYFPEQIETHLAGRSGISCLREDGAILDTGGGLRHALPLLGSDPVFTLNSDAIWTGPNPLLALKSAWDPGRMDGLLMLLPREKAREHRGQGDFFLSDGGQISRRAPFPTAPYVYTGAQIIKTTGLESIEEKTFSLNLLWDQMIASERLYGIIHPGVWVDVGRPEAIAVAEAELASICHV